ncbi:MAG: carbamate kinase [Thermoprotei archaeon]|nr:MAG: carbamate kinase [Thermoprotei archaeon]
MSIFRQKKILVIALGGNALIKRGQRGTFEEQVENLKKIAPTIARLSKDYSIILTHGNGPQVGMLYLQQESISDLPSMPLHACVAMTQSLIGYMIQQAFSFVEKNLETVVITTRVLVDKNDPAFKNPSKPIGPYYTEKEARKFEKDKGWKMVYVEGKGWRRVVPSPRPQKILELGIIKETLSVERIVVAVGGGGIPVIEEKNGYRGVDAVIDKDLASSLLASEIGAEKFIIVTDVEGVYLDYGKPTARLLDGICASDAIKLVEEGYFPPGSMGPKVEAAARFVMITGRTAVIGLLDNLESVVNSLSGTIIKKC